MKRTSLTLTGYNSDTQVDRLKVEGERFLDVAAFSLRPEGVRDCVRTA
jgi:hypothetical protein